MTTRQCSTLVAVLVAPVVAFASALAPDALVYDAKASGPYARLVLPDWDAVDGGIDPFAGNLIPRRTMAHPREFLDWVGGIAAGVSLFCAVAGWTNPFGCGGATVVGAAVWIIGNYPDHPPCSATRNYMCTSCCDSQGNTCPPNTNC